MKKFLPIIFSLISSVAWAQDPHSAPIFSEASSPIREFVKDEGKPWIGRILIENAIEYDPFLTGQKTILKTVTINVDNVGTFMLTNEVSKNDQCPNKDCPDTWEIIEWPQGYAVFPSSISIDEEKIGEFFVYLWLGV